MSANRVIVVGAGIGGLVAAIELASSGMRVSVFERASHAGGKLRAVDVDGAAIDAGPTVFTMRDVFDETFDRADLQFSDFVELAPAATLAHHAWAGGGQLDLYADLERSVDAIGRFAGADEARRYLAFTERAHAIFRTLDVPFMRSPCAGPLALMRAVGWRRLGELLRIAPFSSLWNALGSHFQDARLRQLFGRYATYCGSSPFLAPATLMLIAHVEQAGVWLIKGGMHRLALGLVAAARRLGVTFRFNAEVASIESSGGRASGVTLRGGERVEAESIVVNADSAAVSDGLFGVDAARAVPARRGLTRSLSAMTWCFRARTTDAGLDRHNVFFSSDYAREFDELFVQRRMPSEPTVYLCAQDRGVADAAPCIGTERMLCLINAPADGDTHEYTPAEIHACRMRTMGFLERCGLTLHSMPDWGHATSPTDFHRLFPATGGALYGPASHGWKASFNRAGAATRMPGLYLAGGSTHPGAGLPMAALSGRLAAARLIRERASTARSLPMATPGGISTR